MTTITISRKIEKELKITSRQLGLSKEDFLTRAVLYYLQALEVEIELKKELENWEKASSQDLIKFEKKL